jgi:hypothetical protein
MCGAEGQNRTVDTSLFRAVLCQLSYLGTRTEQEAALLQNGCRKSREGTDEPLHHDSHVQTAGVYLKGVRIERASPYVTRGCSEVESLRKVLIQSPRAL